MNKPYQICKRCIMDTTDPNIFFDSKGICNHCHECEMILKRNVATGQLANEKLNTLVSAVKKAGQGRPYDCVIGVSGGVDSTYLALKVKELGLRPLAVHLDNGWDSELAVSNIQKTLSVLGIDLQTYVINWNEFRDIQLSFLRASTPDSEVPSDHAIMATLYETAVKHNIKYILNGLNFSTEAILPSAWSHGHYDWKYIRSIHRTFGTVPNKTFPHFSIIRFLYYTMVKKIKIVFPLSYIPFERQEAIETLEQKIGWRRYGGKHYESKYTHFFQAYILPTKFGFDKRRAHLSTLICSNKMSREEALTQLAQPLYETHALEIDIDFVSKKLGLSRDEFLHIMSLPPKRFQDYPSYENDFLYKMARSTFHLSQRIFR